jgi:hypothetical protein
MSANVILQWYKEGHFSKQYKGKVIKQIVVR